MRIGQLRHPVSIQELVALDDGIGSSTRQWTEFASTRAAIWSVSAGEQIKNQRIEQQITDRIRIRYIAGVTSAMRLVFDNRIFLIESVVNTDERKRFLDLLCTEEI